MFRLDRFLPARTRPRPASRTLETLLVATVCSAAMGLMPCQARADCFEAAGTYQGVSPLILRAIAWVESHGNPNALHRNTNGSIDIGELQINSIHLHELAAYGIDEHLLRDECVNIYVAAWQLKKQMMKYGDTWDAIGAYHSANARLRTEYIKKIRETLTRWGWLGESR